MKIRSKILFSASAAIIFIVIVYSILSIYLTQTRLNYQITTQLKELIAEKIDALDRFMSERLSDIKIIVNTPIMQSESAPLEEKMVFLRDFEKYSKRYISISIYDNSGIRIGDTRNIGINNNESQKKFVQQALAGNIYFDPYPTFSEYLQAYTFHFSGPLINSSGNIFGAVATRFPAVKINDLLASNFQDPKTSFDADLVSPQGIIIYSNHDRASINQQYKEDLQVLKQLKNDPSLRIASNVEKINNQNFLVIAAKEQGFLDYPGQDWILILNWQTTKIFTSLPNIVIEFGLIALLFFAILLPIAYFFANAFSKPILQLTQSAKYVQKGDFSHPADIKSKDEIGVLAQTFNLMLKQLQELYSKMAQKIKVKTKELSQKVETIQQKNIDLEKTKRATLNILEDIQEEKNKAEAEKNKIEIILQSIGDAVFVVDHQEKIIVFNKIAQDISGFSESEALNQPYKKILNFIIEKNGWENDGFIKNALQSGRIQAMSNHTVLVKKDGSKVQVADSAAPLKTKEGRIIGCVVVFRDVTKEREVEKMKSEFVSVASHQLRTPLTSIKWLLEMIITGDVGKITQKQKKHLLNVFSSNERMISLINDLLNVSRIEAGKIKIEPKEVQIEDVLTKIIKNLQPLAKKNNIKVICHYPDPKLPKMFIDPERIGEAFKNLLTNAIKYNQENGQVNIYCQKINHQISFAIKDTGVGIPANEQNKMYSKFFRGSNVAKMQTEGTGLGLFITKSIIESSSGKIWFESQIGKGTTFYFTLPIKKINN